MRRLTIKYWQELPFLVGELKSASSQLIHEWQKQFNPARSYTTSIDFEDVQIVFEGDYWRVATRLFQMFCQDYQVRLNLNTYMWLATHTTIIKGSLLGDDEFNQYIRENGGYDEVEEFVETNKLVNWHGEDFELHYNHRDMELLQRLGMEILPDKYQYRSKSGYYLPIGIHIRYNTAITKWIRRVGIDRRKYQITHTPMLMIIGEEKDAIFELARYLYVNEGLSDLIIQWADEPDKTEYKIQIQNTEVYVKDRWKEENEEYVKVARGLKVLSGYELESFKVQDILRNSTYSEYGIELADKFYKKLNLPPEKIIGDKKHIYGNKYSYDEGALGSGKPISIDASGIKLKTPYEYVESGKYSEVLLPLVNESRYTKDGEGVDLVDTDIRIVLGIKTQTEQKDDVDLDTLVESGKGEKHPIGSYPVVDFSQLGVDIEDLPIDFTEGVQVEPKRLTNTVKDFKYIPYVLDVEDVGDMYRVEYIDGEELEIPKNDKHLRTRVVFQDRVGVKIKPQVPQLTELLMSLSTDELVNATESEIRGLDGLTRELIDGWIEALVSGDRQALYRSIKGYNIGDPSQYDTKPLDDSEDDFDIFEDINIL